MKPTSLPKKIMRCLSIFWSNYLDLSNMYLRISLRNFEEFSGSPKTAKMPHILTNWRVQRNWTDLERENHPHVLTDENLSNSAKFRIHLQSLDYYRWVNCNFFQDCIRFSVDRKERILLNMYLRISLRNFEEFSGSPKTAKMPHILTNWRFQRNWIDLERSWLLEMS